MVSIKSNGDEIKIPLSKFKLVLLLLASLVFVAGGVLFIINPSTYTDSGINHHPKTEISVVGYACVIFFGMGVVVFIIKLFDNKPGLLVDKNGVMINPGSGSFSSSFVNWSDIDRFGIIDISRTKLIAIYLKNPEKFIESQTNSFKRKLASFSYKNYGTPISITTSSLKCNTDELFKLLTSNLNKTTLKL